MHKKRKKGQITSVLLRTIGMTGLLGISIFAPNAMRSLERLGIGSHSPSDDRLYIKTATTRLKKRGLITFTNKKGRKFLRLTEKGKKELQKFQLREYTIPKPRLWDGRYRVLVFDIKEENRLTRDKLRMELQNLGFYMIQQSVWVHPYNCEDVIILLKSYLHIGKDVIYMVVERIQNDRDIKKHFKLI